MCWAGAATPLADVLDGRTRFEAPAEWSEDATATFLRRCVVHEAIPSCSVICEPDVPRFLSRHSLVADRHAGRGAGETSVRQSFDRFAGAIAYWGWKGGYFDAQSDAKAFHDELRSLLCRRRVAPELSLMAAMGRNWAYGGEGGGSGLHIVDYRSGRTVRGDTCHAAAGGQRSAVAVVNLAAFLGPPGDDSAVLDTGGLADAIRLWTIALDITIHMTAHRDRHDAEQAWRQRPIGFEIANLSGLLLASGVPYDSPEGRATGAGLAALITGAAHAASAEIAGALGAAPDFAARRDRRLSDLHAGRRAAQALAAPESALARAACAAWDRASAEAERHGVRNVRLSCAPAQRDACRLLECDSDGIGPGFALVHYRAAPDGGLRKSINPAIVRALETLGYNRGQIDAIVGHVIGQGTLAGAPALDHAALRDSGMDPDAIRDIEAVIASAPDIRVALSQSGDTGRRFEAGDIEAANRYCCGAMSFADAPHLAPGHLAVFDRPRAAAGRDPRALDVRAAARMRRALAPFLGGANDRTAPVSPDGVRHGRFVVYRGGRGATGASAARR